MTIKLLYRVSTQLMSQSRSAKVMILSSGSALSALVGLLSVAVLARIFSKPDYATYRQTLLAYSFAAPFVTLGLSQALFYFLPSEKERTRGLLVENLVLLGGSGLILTLFLLAGGNHLLAHRFNNPKLSGLLLLFAPYPLLMIPASALNACLMARDRSKQVAVFSIVSRLIMFLRSSRTRVGELWCF